MSLSVKKFRNYSNCLYNESSNKNGSKTKICENTHESNVDTDRKSQSSHYITKNDVELWYNSKVLRKLDRSFESIIDKYTIHTFAPNINNNTKKIVRKNMKTNCDRGISVEDRLLNYGEVKKDKLKKMYENSTKGLFKPKKYMPEFRRSRLDRNGKLMECSNQKKKVNMYNFEFENNNYSKIQNTMKDNHVNIKWKDELVSQSLDKKKSKSLSPAPGKNYKQTEIESSSKKQRICNKTSEVKSSLIKNSLENDLKITSGENLQQNNCKLIESNSNKLDGKCYREIIEESNKFVSNQNSTSQEYLSQTPESNQPVIIQNTSLDSSHHKNDYKGQESLNSIQKNDAHESFSSSDTKNSPIYASESTQTLNIVISKYHRDSECSNETLNCKRKSTDFSIKKNEESDLSFIYQQDDCDETAQVTNFDANISES